MEIDKIYELIYSPITTPQAILNNIYLENYESINFYKKDGLIIGEMKCTCYGDDYSSCFCYYFDKNEFLEKIIKKDKYGECTVFDREKELLEAKQDYAEQRKELLSVG